MRHLILIIFISSVFAACSKSGEKIPVECYAINSELSFKGKVSRIDNIKPEVWLLNGSKTILGECYY